MRHTDLCGGPGRRPAVLWPAGGGARPPLRAASGTAGVVPLGPPVVDGPHRRGPLRAPTIASNKIPACTPVTRATSHAGDASPGVGDNTRCIEFSKKGTARGTLPIAGKNVPLLGKQRLHPIDYRAYAGGAAQITVNDDPVFGCDFGDRRSQPLEQRLAVADIAGQYAAAGTGADRFQMHKHR